MADNRLSLTAFTLLDISMTAPRFISEWSTAGRHFWRRMTGMLGNHKSS
jgi:hypothetical protein